jgi:hypothetical protein
MEGMGLIFCFRAMVPTSHRDARHAGFSNVNLVVSFSQDSTRSLITDFVNSFFEFDTQPVMDLLCSLVFSHPNSP